MEFKLLLALFFVGLVAFTYADGSGEDDDDSGNSKDESMGSWGDSREKADDDCDRLVEGSDENDGKCDLVDGIKEAAEDSDCTPEQNTTINNWLIIFQQALSVSVSVEERLTIALSSIQKFQMENPDCYEILQYSNISSWGYLASFTQVIEYRQSKKMESCTTLDDDDSCPLFEGLLNCTEGSYEQQAAVQEWINSTLIGICGNMSMSIEKRNVLLFQAISEFFSIHAEWQFTFFEFNIAGFGSFQQFFEVTRTYYQSSQVNVILGGDASTCEFTTSFNNQIDAICGDSSIDVTVKKQLKLFRDQCNQQISGATTAKERLAIFIKLMNQWTVTYKNTTFLNLILGIQIDGFGSLWQLINCGPYRIGFSSGRVTVLIPGASTFSPATTKSPTCSCTCEPTKLTTMA